jgi:multidrug resistance protein
MSKNNRDKKPVDPQKYQMFMRLGLLTIAIFVSLLGFSIVIPLMPYYVATALRLTPAQAAMDGRVGEYGGWLIAIYALMQFILAPVWGRLSDGIGRKPILIVSLIGDAVFYTMFGMCQHSLVGLFVARALAGIVSSGTMAVAQAYVADVTPPEYRAAGMGHIGAAFGLGFVLGPAIGGALGRFNLGLPLYLAAAIALLNAIYVWRILPETVDRAKRGESPESASLLFRIKRMQNALSGPIWFLFLTTFMATFAFANLEGTFTAYIVQSFRYTNAHAVWITGLVFAYIGMILVLVQGGAIRPLVARFGETNLVIAGIALMALGFLTFALPHHLRFLMLGPMIPISIGSALNSPSLRSLISRYSASDVQGGTLGLSASFDSLARFLGPAVGGLIYKDIGRTAPYWLAGVLMLITLLFALSQRSKMLAIPVAKAKLLDLETQAAPSQ